MGARAEWLTHTDQSRTRCECSLLQQLHNAIPHTLMKVLQTWLCACIHTIDHAMLLSSPHRVVAAEALRVEGNKLDAALERLLDPAKRAALTLAVSLKAVVSKVLGLSKGGAKQAHCSAVQYSTHLVDAINLVEHVVSFLPCAVRRRNCSRHPSAPKLKQGLQVQAPGVAAPLGPQEQQQGR